jgi:hypothetical protein
LSYPEKFDPTKFTDIDDYVYKKPQSDVSSEGTLNTGMTLSLVKPTQVTALYIALNSDGSELSQPFNNDDRADTPIDVSKHVSVLGSDPVSVAWKLLTPGGVKSAKFELFSATDKTKAIWTKEVADVAAADLILKKESATSGGHTGCFAFSDIVIPKTKLGEDDDAFPDKWLTVEHGPYQLKLTIKPAAGTGDSVAWTYLDVVVSEITLDWGADDLIPTTTRDDIEWPPDKKYRVCNKWKIRDKEIAIIAALRSNGTDYANHEVLLEGNIFRTTDPGDADNFIFNSYKSMWGLGPRIPLIATVKVLSAAAASVSEPKALGNTPFLWDWTDIPFNNGDYRRASTQTFLSTSFGKPADAGTAPPDSINCHKKHGGKRGGDPVFPKQNDDKAPQEIVDGFPFKVVECTNRKWAAFSYARTSGTNAGKTGAIFQPSRIAGDTYKVRVLLAKPKATIDCTTKQSDLLIANAGLPTVTTGAFKILRKVNLSYVRKNTALTAMGLIATDTYYLEAGVKINFVSTDTGLDGPTFLRLLQDTINTASGTAARSGKKFMDPAFDQSTGVYGIVFKSWAQLQTEYCAKACKAYADKTAKRTKRKQTKRKREFADAILDYQTKNVGCILDEAQASWYGDLSVKQQAKVDDFQQQFWTTDDIGANNQHDYEMGFSNGSKVLLQKLSGKYMQERMTQPGIFFVHYKFKYALRDFDGTITEPTVDVGGIAPYPENDIDRALFLVYMPSADPGGTTMDSVDVTAHEIGHNLCLKHAKCYRDGKFDGGGHDVKIHEKNEDCLMNYDRQAVKSHCGFCMLRLRGWATKAEGAFVALSNDADVNAS